MIGVGQRDIDASGAQRFDGFYRPFHSRTDLRIQTLGAAVCVGDAHHHIRKPISGDRRKGRHRFGNGG